LIGEPTSLSRAAGESKRRAAGTREHSTIPARIWRSSVSNDVAALAGMHGEGACSASSTRPFVLDASAR
jgi:hypothetical protein